MKFILVLIFSSVLFAHSPAVDRKEVKIEYPLTKEITDNALKNFKKKDYTNIAKRIIAEAHKDSSAWDRLAWFVDTYGYRPAGSKELNQATEWIAKEFQIDGFKNVKREPTMVPYWTRNFEQANLVKPFKMIIPMAGLGGSVGTPNEGIKAEVLLVDDKKDLDSKRDQAKGKIVVFNHEFTNYGETVQYRYKCGDWASEYGAVAALIRSVSPIANSHAHTGLSTYDSTFAKIPKAAISLEVANLLKRVRDRGDKSEIYLKMDAKNHDSTVTHNVMFDYEGTSLNDEIVVAGGHIDAWDAGQGAHDDGAPCYAVWEAVKLLKKLGLRPKRTIRVCFWTAEEIGIYGGKEYAKNRADEKHFGAFEFDSGLFKPFKIGYSSSDELLNAYKTNADPALAILDSKLEVADGGAGADISPLKEYNVPQMSLSVDSDGEYFRYHHTAPDMVDHIDKAALNDCISAIAIALYIYADM